MNFKGDFKKLGNVNIDALKARLALMTEDEWDLSTKRQEIFKTHQHTQTIHLIFDEDFRHANPTIHPMYHELKEYLHPFEKLISDTYSQGVKAKRLKEKFGAGYFVRMNIVKLKPHGEIKAHLDRNYTLAHSHRIHIPIVTNDKVNFSVADKTISMKEGEVWEINNRQVHHVENNSDVDRIHIILDWAMPGERCCCSRLANPQGVCSVEACKETDHANLPCSCFK